MGRVGHGLVPDGGRHSIPTAMSAPYQDLVAQLRVAFPKPVSDRMHDAYFVFSFLRALDEVDA
jgi:hypothetical protein